MYLYLIYSSIKQRLIFISWLGTREADVCLDFRYASVDDGTGDSHFWLVRTKPDLPIWLCWSTSHMLGWNFVISWASILKRCADIRWKSNLSIQDECCMEYDVWCGNHGHFIYQMRPFVNFNFLWVNRTHCAQICCTTRERDMTRLISYGYAKSQKRHHWLRNPIYLCVCGMLMALWVVHGRQH